MAAFRDSPAATIGGLTLTEVHDYQAHEIRPHRLGRARSAPCPSPRATCSSSTPRPTGTRFAARPSGTEPKIKFYLFARTPTDGVTDREKLAEIKARTTRRLDQMAADIEQYVDRVVKGGV